MMPVAHTHMPLTHQRKRHEQRMAQWYYPKIEDDPELAAAFHSLQLHWLKSVPGYREALKQRISEAAKQSERRAHKIETNQQTVYGAKLGAVLAAKQREDQLERLAGY